MTSPECPETSLPSQLQTRQVFLDNYLRGLLQ
jgi:hypothetical protein